MREFVLRKDASFARGSHGELERDRECRVQGGLGGRVRRLNRWTFREWRTGGSCAEVECRGLRLDCGCIVSLKVLVCKQLSSVQDVPEGKMEHLTFSFLVGY